MALLLKKISRYDAVIGKVAALYAGKRYLYVNSVINQLQKKSNLVLLAQFCVPWGRLISLDFLRKHNVVFSEARFMEDALFALLFALSRPKVRFCNDIVLYIRDHPKSMTASINEEKVLCVMYNTKEMIEAAKTAPFWLKLRLDGNALVYFLYRNKLKFFDVVLKNKRIFNLRDRFLIAIKLFKLTKNFNCLRFL